MPVPGALVAWWDGSELSLAVAAGDEKQKVRLVLEGGREERVTPSRIAFEIEAQGAPPGHGVEERRAAGRRVEAARERITRLAGSVDVQVLWELVRESPASFDDRALAELALGGASGADRAAVVQALLLDGARFVRKGAAWEPRPPEALQEILLQRDRTTRRADERRAALDALAAAARGSPYVPAGNAEERRYLEALEEVAVRDVEASETARAAALDALAASGLRHDRPEEGAFRLLRITGRFSSDDENVQILRYRLHTAFPDQVVEAARRAAERGFRREGREDLTALGMVTIDGPWTREIDDGLSVEPRPGGGFRLGVHVADPSAFVEPGDPVDVEALARAVTHYFPDRRLPMLPEPISEGAASLVEGLDRPALSFLVDLDEEGTIAGASIVRSIIRSRARLTYDLANEAIAGGAGPWGSMLRDLDAAAALRESSRMAAGAVRIAAPDVDVRVLPDGRIVLERTHPGTPAQRVVSEAMVVAGAVAAGFCSARGLPVIYRRQPAPERPPSTAASSAIDLVAARAARRALRRGEVGLAPGPHHALGLAAYAQTTSPIRRFQDLATHRQIIGAIEGTGPVYGAAALQRIAATTEAAEIEGRRAERAADRYWLLRYLESFAGSTVDGIVVEVEPRPVVLLLETLLEEPLPGLAGVEIGQAVRLRVERVNARAELVVLRPAGEA